MRKLVGYKLWLGHVGDVENLSVIHSTGIKSLVDLALNESPAKISRDLVYCRFPLIDGSGNPLWLLRLAVNHIVFILQADVPTLVYCGAGMSRSPTIVGAAISIVKKCSLEDGLAIALQSGSADVSPGLLSDTKVALNAEQNLLNF